jgi:hypothetical protein
MRRFTTLFAVLVAVMFVAAACGKKTDEAGEKKAEQAEKVETAEKADEPAAEAKPEAPAAEAKPEEPAAEAKPEEPAAEAKPEEPAAEAKPEEPAAEAKPEEPAAEAKPEDPAAKAAPKAVNPHSASADNLLVATYEVPALDDDTAKKLTLALADRDGVVSAKADQENGLFKVTYSSGCPHSMEGALKGVVADTKLQGVTAREGDAPAAGGCGGCANKATCGGHAEHH